MSLAELTRDAVLTAIAEFDELGRTAFLENYGFGPAREYFVELNGRHYDSKAIAGAAHRYANPAAGPLATSEFSGGELTVKRRLESLGFRVSRITDGSALAESSTPPGSSSPALPLTLHTRHGRHAASVHLTGPPMTSTARRSQRQHRLRWRSGCLEEAILGILTKPALAATAYRTARPTAGAYWKKSNYAGCALRTWS